MESILLVGTVSFSVAALYFFVNKPKKGLNTPFLVTFVTLVSYVVMLEGSLISLNSNGEALYWTRWAFYGFSCTLLAWTIAKSLGFKAQQSFQLVYMTAIVMLTGVLSSIYDGHFMLLMFIISSIAYLLMIWPILESTGKTARYIKPFILFGWSVFPLFFIISPEGYGLIGNEIPAAAYLLLDWGTKIGFYAYGSKQLKY